MKLYRAIVAGLILMRNLSTTLRHQGSGFTEQATTSSPRPVG